MLTIAIRAARKAGNLITKKYENLVTIGASQKYISDFITNLSHDTHHLIIDVIHKYYPKHIIITQEHGKLFGEEQKVQWIIDPLGDTSNFIKHFPHFSISIAVRIKDHTEVAVIYDPIRNELFTANRGQGAQLNGYRLRGTDVKNLDSAILAIDFPFKCTKDTNLHIKTLCTILTKCADFRRTGSAALDLAYIAAGRIDGFFAIDIKPYGLAAGTLLVRESGSLVSNFIDTHNHMSSGNIVAGNQRIVKAILSLLRK